MESACNNLLRIFLLLLFFCVLDISSCTIQLVDYENQLFKIDDLISDSHRIQSLVCHDNCAKDPSDQCLRLVPRSNLTKNDIKNLIFYTAQKKCFNSITLKIEGNDLAVSFEYAQILKQLEISGVWNDKEHYKKLYIIQEGQQFNYDVHCHSILTIKQHLFDQGYCNARITDTIKKDAHGNISVDLHIETGKCCNLSKITVSMQGSSSNKLLEKKIHLQLAPLIDTAYNKQHLDECLQHCKSLLIHEGYYPLDTLMEHTIESEAISLSITYTLSEQRKFVFQGNSFFEDEELLQRLLLFEDAAWSLPPIILCKELTDFYTNAGFEQVQIRVEECHGVCTFFIQQGLWASTKTSCGANPTAWQPSINNQAPRIFGKTIICNSTSLDDHIFMRELAYQPGQPWDGDAIRKSVARIQARECCDLVEIVPLLHTIDNQTPLCLEVHAQKPYELRLSGGMSLQQMSKNFDFCDISSSAAGLLLIKNPFNRADLFGIEADTTRGERTLSIWYKYPWIFGQPIHTLFEINASEYKQPGLRHNQHNLYNFFQKGFFIGLAYDQNFEGQLTLGTQWLSTHSIGHHDPLLTAKIIKALNFEPLLVNKDIPYFLIEPTITINRLVNQLNPTSGFLGIFSAKLLIPVPTENISTFFARFFIDQSIFIPIHSIILALRARAGHIFAVNFKNIIPAERFYLGGANSIRSYETDMCPPLGIVPGDMLRFLVPQGARSMIMANVELRIPAKQWLWLSIFQDIGALSNNRFADIKAGWVAGTGAGIRFITPIGPLRFDIAYKWAGCRQGQSRYCWFLSFGNAF